MSLSQGNSSSCDLSHIVYKLARIISCYVQRTNTGLPPQEKKIKNGMGNYSIIPTNLRKEVNQGRVNKSCSPRTRNLGDPLEECDALCVSLQALSSAT